MAVQLQSGGGFVAGGRGKPRVGLVPAFSSPLKEQGAFLAVFTKQAILTFYGHLQARVLGGVVLVNSYALKPCDGYLTMCAPQDSCNSAISMEVMDPLLNDKEFVEYLKPFRQQSGSVHFHCKQETTETSCVGRQCITIDIGEEDIDSLNGLVTSEWQGITAIAVLKPFKTDFTDFLPQYGLGLKNSQKLKGFCNADSNRAVHIPPPFRTLAWELVTHIGTSVLICGDQGTGKSTLGRYLINYMLNRFPAVAYLDCDPGQCEFTCPEVLSLHVLTEPVFGPSYVHQRTPVRAFYFGDTSPKADPEYYIRLVQSLYAHFTSSVRAQHPNIPLIINTCGWLHDMGVQLFLDILRSLAPTHVVRLVRPNLRLYSENMLKMLPPLTEDLLTSTPGLFTPVDRSSAPYTHQPFVQRSVIDLFLVEGGADGCGQESGEPPSPQAAVVGGEGEDTSSDIEMYGSSEDEFSITEGSEAEISDREERVKRKRKRRRRLHLTSAKLSNKRPALAPDSQLSQIKPTEDWLQVLSYKVKCLLATPNSFRKNSARQRELSLQAYFSPLISAASEIARLHSLPDTHGNLLRYAPPLAVPWADVALHVAHKQVPTDHLLYAFNGKVICLGHAQSEQIVCSSVHCSEMFKLLKMHSPPIEFLGLGLLRGIDPARKLFYVTTPLSGSCLDRVNVFVLGNPDSVNFNVPPSSSSEAQAVPYHTKRFKPTELGEYVWSFSHGR